MSNKNDGGVGMETVQRKVERTRYAYFGLGKKDDERRHETNFQISERLP